MSPTALKVTKRAIEEGRERNLAECLIVEYRLAYACLNKDSDFAEGNHLINSWKYAILILIFLRVNAYLFSGVRALLIDKDKKPIWNPKNLKEVSDSFIEQRFAPLSSENELKLDGNN